MSPVIPAPLFGAKTFLYVKRDTTPEQDQKLIQSEWSLNGYSSLGYSLNADVKPSEKTDIVVIHTPDDRGAQKMLDVIQKELKLPAMELPNNEPKTKLGKLIQHVFGRRGPGPLEMPMVLAGKLQNKANEIKTKAQYLEQVKGELVSRAMVPDETNPSKTLKGFTEYYADVVKDWDKTAAKLFDVVFPGK